MRGRGRLAPLAIACLVVGGGLMLAFDAPAARIAGVVLLAAWIVTGAFALASPEHLEREDDPEPSAEPGERTTPSRPAEGRSGGGEAPPRPGG